MSETALGESNTACCERGDGSATGGTSCSAGGDVIRFTGDEGVNTDAGVANTEPELGCAKTDREFVGACCGGVCAGVGDCCVLP